MWSQICSVEIKCSNSIVMTNTHFIIGKVVTLLVKLSPLPLVSSSFDWYRYNCPCKLKINNGCVVIYTYLELHKFLGLFLSIQVNLTIRATPESRQWWTDKLTIKEWVKRDLLFQFMIHIDIILNKIVKKVIKK